MAAHSLVQQHEPDVCVRVRDGARGSGECNRIAQWLLLRFGAPPGVGTGLLRLRNATVWPGGRRLRFLLGRFRLVFGEELLHEVLFGLGSGRRWLGSLRLWLFRLA